MFLELKSRIIKKALANVGNQLCSRCLLTTIAYSNPAKVIFRKSRSFFWISYLFLSSHYFVHLIFVLAYFMKSLIYLFKCLLLQGLQLLLSKCHHKFKLDARNNGWTKKESKIFRRNSVISQILHWLDWNRQLWSKDI